MGIYTPVSGLDRFNQVAFGLGLGLEATSLKATVDEQGGAGQNFLTASIWQCSSMAKISSLFYSIAESIPSTHLRIGFKCASYLAFYVGGPLCLYAGAVRQGNYETFSQRYNSVVQILLPDYQYLQLAPEISERKMKTLIYITDHATNMAVCALVVGVVAYTALGHYYFGGAVLASLACYAIQISTYTPPKMKIFMEKYLPVVQLMCFALSPQIPLIMRVFNAVVAATFLHGVSAGFLNTWDSALKPLGKISGWMPNFIGARIEPLTLQEIDAEPVQQRHLSKQVMLKLMTADANAFAPNAACCSKEVETGFPENREDFDDFLTAFRTMDLRPRYDHLKHTLIERSEHFRQLFKDKGLSDERIDDLARVDHLRKKHPEGALDFELRLASLKYKDEANNYQAQLMKTLKEKGFAERELHIIADRFFRQFLIENDRRLAGELNTDKDYLLAHDFRTALVIKYPQYRFGNHIEDIFHEYYHKLPFRPPGNGLTNKSLDAFIEELAGNQDKAEFLANWVSTQMIFFIQGIKGERTIVAGNKGRERAEAAIGKFAQYLTYFKKTEAQGGPDRISRENALELMATKGGRYCAEQQYVLSDELLGTIKHVEYEDRIARELQFLREKLMNEAYQAFLSKTYLLSLLPESIKKDLHFREHYRNYFSLGFYPFAPHARENLLSIEFIVWKFTHHLRDAMVKKYIDSLGDAFTVERPGNFVEHVRKLIRENNKLDAADRKYFKALLANEELHNKHKQGLYRLMLVMHGMIIPKDPALLGEPGPGQSIEIDVADDVQISAADQARLKEQQARMQALADRQASAAALP